MSTAFAERPDAAEHAEYYGRYIVQLPDGDVLQQLRAGVEELNGLLSGLTETQALKRYAPDKWSIKEVLGHMLDVERVFAYRALRMARADETPLPGFDQDGFVAAARYDERPLASFLAEYRHVRAANLELFGSFDRETLLRRGTASGYSFTVRALIWIIAGHERHHLTGFRRDYGIEG